MIRFGKYVWVGLVSLAGFAACTNSKMPAPEPEPFTVTAPANLGTSVPAPERNPFTREGVLLGRKLFYDPILSGNNKISCATCHLPEKAFSDGLALSTNGASGQALHRSAPPLQNLAWHKGWFWDGGAKDIESLNFGPIKHADEMAQNLTELVKELQNHSEYPRLFKAAFRTDTISTALLTRALAQFERTLISANSRYDKYVRNEGGKLSSQELEGLSLFRQKCASCHATDFFTDHDYHNNGLDNTYSEAHEALAWGRGRISEKPEDIGKYKTPTLRNIALTAPYMHDGRFKTLEEVLDHYRSGVKVSATLDARLQQNGKTGIEMTEEEKTRIIQFLQTLTDPEFTSNPDFSAPR
ncbi:cytochrome-c peroxidase [Adhaeribacter soli]|uniref:Cytochrome-c peroxidase n=1 Tax=Adhaeribacter soli TaxID=2607655 RepID=A0A5N1IWR9_9BACT|nr:cytochrome c peroxidase [Adhaeribacter soli]KAA9333596.1 cytochrome-c peroxidase [Adhaeribacter soli]